MYLNKWVLNNFLKSSTVLALRMSFGSEFHSLDAAPANARSPNVLSVFTFGGTSDISSFDHKSYLVGVLMISNEEVTNNIQ